MLISEMIFDNFMMKLRKIPLEEGDEDIRQGQNNSNEENVPQALKVHKQSIIANQFHVFNQARICRSKET